MALLLIAALLFLIGVSFARQASGKTGLAALDAAMFAVVCWFLAAMIAGVALLWMARP